MGTQMVMPLPAIAGFHEENLSREALDGVPQVPRALPMAIAARRVSVMHFTIFELAVAV